MPNIQKWYDIVKAVEKANLDKQTIENKIKKNNKIAYRQQLDREVEQKHQQHLIHNQIKLKELQQARKLAETQKISRLKQKILKTDSQKQYGQQNLHLIAFHQQQKQTAQDFQHKTYRNFLEHPFVKLVDQQQRRNKYLREKFQKQNQINHLQEQMKNQAKSTIRYQQRKERKQFEEYIDNIFQKRSEQRERFKNKYLKIRKNQCLPSEKFIENNASIEKTYITYLNNQIKRDHQRKQKEKQGQIDDQRITKFYSKNAEPDSSPAYLGRNPLSHQRKRQLYYINKHLYTTHERSQTTNLGKGEPQSEQLHSLMKRNQLINIDGYNKLAVQLNPEQKGNVRMKYPPLRTYENQNNSESAIKTYGSNQQSDFYGSAQKSRSKQSQNEKKRNNLLFNNKSTIEEEGNSSKRIKSQFVERPQLIPMLSKPLQARQYTQLPQQKLNLSESHRPIGRSSNNKNNCNEQKVNQKSSIKKQYIRFNVITGKNQLFYI